MNSVKKAQDEARIAYNTRKVVRSLVDCSYRRGSCLYLAFWREWDRLEKEAKKQEISEEEMNSIIDNILSSDMYSFLKLKKHRVKIAMKKLALILLGKHDRTR